MEIKSGQAWGVGVQRGWFFPTECKEETEACNLFLIVGGKDNSVIVML